MDRSLVTTALRDGLAPLRATSEYGLKMIGMETNRPAPTRYEAGMKMDAAQTPGYVDAPYLEAAARLLRPVKARSYALMRIAPGQSILDVGCGPGIDTLSLGKRVGARGRVLGVDADEQMVAAANRRAMQAGLGDRVRHRQADAGDLPLESGALDTCRSERLFIHLSDPARALREMIRVTRPGGWIVIADSDWGSLSIDTGLVQIERRLARFRAEHLLSNGYSGRRLLQLFKASGLVDIRIEALPVVIRGDGGLLRYLTKLDEVEQDALDAGAIGREELDAWRSDLMRADGQGTAFASMSMVLAAGRKP